MFAECHETLEVHLRSGTRIIAVCLRCNCDDVAVRLRRDYTTIADILRGDCGDTAA